MADTSKGYVLLGIYGTDSCISEDTAARKSTTIATHIVQIERKIILHVSVDSFVLRLPSIPVKFKANEFGHA